MGHSFISYSGFLIGYGINFDTVLGDSKYAFENFTAEDDYDDDVYEEEGSGIDDSKKSTFKPSSTLAIKLIRKEWFKYLKKFHPELIKMKMPAFSIICESYTSTYEPVASSSDCHIIWGEDLNDEHIKIVPSKSGENECESLSLEYKFPLNSRKLFVDFMARLELTYRQDIKTISDSDLEKPRKIIGLSVYTGTFGQIKP